MTWRIGPIRVLLFLALLIPALAGGAAMASPNDDAARIYAFRTTFDGLYARYAALLDRSAELDEIALALAEGRIEVPVARRRGDGIIKTIETERGSLAVEIAELRVPAFSDPRFGTMVQALADYLPDLNAQVATVVTASADGYRSALAGDALDQERALVRQLAAFMVMLEGENRLADAQALSIDRGQPLYHYMRLVAHINDAMIAWIGAIRDTIVDPEAAHLFAAQADSLVGASLDAADAELEEGLASLAALEYVLSTVPEEQLAGAVREILGSFRPSFEVERQIVALCRDLMPGLRTLAEDPAAADRIFASFEADLAALVDRRMSLQAERVELLGQVQ